MDRRGSGGHLSWAVLPLASSVSPPELRGPAVGPGGSGEHLPGRRGRGLSGRADPRGRSPPLALVRASVFRTHPPADKLGEHRFLLPIIQ